MASVWGGTNDWLAWGAHVSLSHPWTTPYTGRGGQSGKCARLGWGRRKESGAGGRGLSGTEPGPVPCSPRKVPSHTCSSFPRPGTQKLREIMIIKMWSRPLQWHMFFPRLFLGVCGNNGLGGFEKHACLKGAGGLVTLERRCADIGT